MTPEEFHHFDNFHTISESYMKDLRLKSLSWVLDCYDAGTIRKRTITNLIPEIQLIELLVEMEELEKYEECSKIKRFLDTIYYRSEAEHKKLIMSKKRQKEIIELLENTIITEHKKKGGGNKELIVKLTSKLEEIKKKKFDK